MNTVAMKAKFEEAGIPYESIKVFGAVRCNVHVICAGHDTANKWVMLLSEVFKGAKVVIVKTSWNAVHNKNTCLKPTQRHGYLIAVAA